MRKIDFSSRLLVLVNTSLPFFLVFNATVCAATVAHRIHIHISTYVHSYCIVCGNSFSSCFGS